MPLLRQKVRDLGVALARLAGSDIRDSVTGKVLGRALLVPWRGRVIVVGLEAPVIPKFLEQTRLTHWKQDLGFTAHPPPDFPNERRP